MTHLLLGIADIFFRITASSFKISGPPSENTDQHQSAANQESGRKHTIDISVDLLSRYSTEDVITAIKEMSFQHSLALLRSLHQASRQFVLAALKEQHDLRAALDFALEYEDNSSAAKSADLSCDEKIAVTTTFLRNLAENHSKQLPYPLASSAGLGGNVVPLAKPSRLRPRKE